MGLFGRKDKGADAGGDRMSIYYASDVHGSDQCWRKFLGAGKFYGVQSLIMGGDLTGKAIVPILRRDGAHVAHFLGDERVASNQQELDELEAAIRYNGMYPWITDADAVAAHSVDEAAREALFEEVMLDELRRWIALGDERMAPQGIDVFVMGGNDDPFSVDEVLSAASHVVNCDDRIVMVGPHEMISCSFANHTPWDSPRELDEDALYARIKRLADQLERPESAIFNLHVPPYDTGLDRAIEVDRETMTHVYRKGQPNEVPVGSTAVRQIIEDYQPMLSLHGHIHESRGEARLGRTLALNTGSEYNSGRIHGAVIVLGDAEVVSHQFVVG